MLYKLNLVQAFYLQSPLPINKSPTNNSLPKPIFPIQPEPTPHGQKVNKTKIINTNFLPVPFPSTQNSPNPENINPSYYSCYQFPKLPQLRAKWSNQVHLEADTGVRRLSEPKKHNRDSWHLSIGVNASPNLIQGLT